MANKEFHSLLKSVVEHWNESAKVYKAYMDNGKKFRYAEVLKLLNTAVKNLFTDHIAIVPVVYKQDVEAIIEHYTIWTNKWNNLQAELNPAPDDVFVFENEHRFPRAAAQRLEAVFYDLPNA